jgi:hypothetical protein
MSGQSSNNANMQLIDLNDRQKALIDPADRVALGLDAPAPAGLAPQGDPNASELHWQQRLAKAVRKSEKAEQNRLCDWLRLNRISFDQDRMDKRRTGTTGWPDFTLVHASRVLLGELKVNGRQPSPAQQKRFAELLHGGTEVRLWHSFDEARREIMGWFWSEFRISLPENSDGS